MNLLERLRRPNWLREVQTLTVLIMVATVVLAAVRLYLIVFGQIGTPVDLRAGSLAGVAGARPELSGVAVPRDAAVEAVITDPTGRQMLMSVLTWLPSMLLLVAMLVLLFRMVRQALRSDPFTRRTARGLRVLAGVAILGGEVAAVVEAIAAMELVNTVLPRTAPPYGTLTLPIAWVFVGFCLLALGELVRQGCSMREELAEVI